MDRVVSQVNIVSSLFSLPLVLGREEINVLSIFCNCFSHD